MMDSDFYLEASALLLYSCGGKDARMEINVWFISIRILILI
jgi:hypothetical protein